MGDGDDLPLGVALCVEPSRDPLHQNEDRLSAMGGRPGIAQPFSHGLRLLRLHLVESATCPTPVIAVTQHRFGGRVEL